MPITSTDPDPDRIARRFIWESLARMLPFSLPLGLVVMSGNPFFFPAVPTYVSMGLVVSMLILMPAGVVAEARRQLARFRENGEELSAELIAASVTRVFVSPLDPITSFDVCAERLSSIRVAEALHYNGPGVFRHDPFAGVMRLGRMRPLWADGCIRVSIATTPEQLTHITVQRRPGLQRLNIQRGDALRSVEKVCAELKAALEERRIAMTAAARAQALERSALHAKLAALQAQVEPHFLFNTLANLKYLIRTDQEAAQHMVDHLVGYLHVALPDMRSASSTVERELALAEHYLAIMQIRLGERLAFEVRSEPQVRACAMPAAMLISLVENAVKHGIERTTGPGTVKISACRKGAFVELSVMDDGAGLDVQAGQGVGLSNIHERLALLYGPAATVDVRPGLLRGVIATLRIPYSEAKEPA